VSIPFVAAIGISSWGALGGAVLSLIWPARIFEHVVLRGSSLVASPLISGVVMHRYGQWRDRRREPRSHLATFWGGALFAFSMALARLIWVAR
jgi:hypothetical protein